MALIVETGIGIENAETYCDVDFVNLYCRKRNHSSWNAGSNNVIKEAAIMRAMDYIESLRYKGDKSNSINDLQWSRTGVYLNGILVDSNVIPLKLKNALCEASVVEFGTKNSITEASQRAFFNFNGITLLSTKIPFK